MAGASVTRKKETLETQKKFTELQTKRRSREQMKKRSGSRKETKTEEGRGSFEIIRQKIIDRDGLRPTPNVYHLVDPPWFSLQTDIRIPLRVPVLN